MSESSPSGDALPGDETSEGEASLDVGPQPGDGGLADEAWRESLRTVMRQVINSLPEHTTLGELVHAARSNAQIAPVLNFFTVQELIDTAKIKRAEERPHGQTVQYDEDGNPLMDLGDVTGPAVIRRRADVPDGDLRVLKVLAERGTLRELDLANAASLTADQLRIIVRHLRTKGYLHIEGSGGKRRYKITRHGSGYLKKG